MRLFLKQNDLLDEAEIHICYKDIDEKLQRVIEKLQLMDFSVMGRKEGAIYKIAVENIYYFESVDDKIFAYCELDVYEVSYKLYELEEMVSEYSFARVSKSVIINIDKIKSIKPQLNGRFEAILLNEERQIVSRHYINGLREKFIGGKKNE